MACLASISTTILTGEATALAGPKLPDARAIIALKVWSAVLGEAYSAPQEQLRALMRKAVENITVAIEGGDLKASIELLKTTGMYGDGRGNALWEQDPERLLKMNSARGYASCSMIVSKCWSKGGKSRSMIAQRMSKSTAS